MFKMYAIMRAPVVEKDRRDARSPRFIKAINTPCVLRTSQTTSLSDPTHYNKQLNMHTRHVRIAIQLHWKIRFGKKETVSNGTVVDDVKREHGKLIGITCHYVDDVMVERTNQNTSFRNGHG